MGFLNGLLGDMMKESTGYDLRKMKKLTKMVGKKNLLLLGAGAAVAGGVAASAAGGQQQQPGTGPSSWAAPTGPPPAGPPRAHPSPSPVAAPPPNLPPIPGAAAQSLSSPPPSSSPPSNTAPPPLPPVPGSAAPPAGGAPPATAPASAAVPAPAEAADAQEPAVSPELTFAIVRTMVAAALADGHLSEEEKSKIHGRLGESGLSADRIQQIHRDLVIPPTPAELAALTREASELEAMYRFGGLLILADGEVAELERSWLDRLAVAFGFDGAKKAELEAELFQ